MTIFSYPIFNLADTLTTDPNTILEFALNPNFELT